VLVIPYVDMLRAVVRRTRAGMSPFAADRKHLHHTMLEIGHSHRQSVLILYAWAALFAGTVVGLSIVTVHLAVLIWITLAAIGALALLSIPKLRWWERTRPAAFDVMAEDKSHGGVASGATVTPSASDPGTARPVARGPVGPLSAGPVSAGPRSAGPRSAGPHSAEPRSPAGRGHGNGWHAAGWQTMPNGVGDQAEAGGQHAESPVQDGGPIGWSRRHAGP